MSDTQLYIEDFVAGQRFVGKRRVVTEEDFLAFAKLTGDAHPIHYDAAYAAATYFKRPIAHGLLVMAWSALGATELSPRLENAMVAFVKQGCRFVAPVFVGDAIVPEYTVASVEIRERSGRLSFDVRMLKDDGAVCFQGTHVYQLLRSPPGGAA